MNRQEAEKAAKEYVEQRKREGSWPWDVPRMEFVQHDGNGFVFAMGDCMIGVQESTGFVIILPSQKEANHAPT